MANLGAFDLVDQCAAVAMLVENAATQIRRLGEAPDDSARLVTCRKACQLARDTLDGFLERLPAEPKRKGRKS